MISRRNIRVKVMQTIYSLETQEQTEKPGEAVKVLQKHFELSKQLFTGLLFTITEVARYAETDSRVRASKHLPSDQDRNVNIKLAGNELLWLILENAGYQQLLKTYKPQLIINNDLIKKLYIDLADSAEYKNYIAVAGRDKKSEREILEFIFTNLMLPNDFFVTFMEEHFSNWDDDIDMMDQLMLTCLGKPQAFTFGELLSTEKWDFAKNLLQAVIDKKEFVMDLIKPRLKNWDADRIAALDMILMQMGVCEFLYFETIPPKVTINEYIDLAKEYSTPQSGQFVNGILDNIHKELVQSNNMHKVDFKAPR